METVNATRHSTVHCEKHGDRREAFVCDHLLCGMGHGFFFAADSENPHPDAWCAQCEEIRITHGGSTGEWNETSESLIRVRLVCGDCYEEIKAANLLGTESNRVQ